MFRRATDHPFSIAPLAGLDNLRQLSAPVYDVLLCVHGRQKIPMAALKEFPLGGVNVHPFMKEFPGANPVGRALLTRNRVMTVSSHQMTEDVDAGPEIFTARSSELLPLSHALPMTPTQDMILDIQVKATYNDLYPLYAECVRETLRLLEKRLT